MFSCYLCSLIWAIENVKPKYVVDSEQSYTDNIKYLNERTFAYELYRQWQNLIEHVDMVVNAEVPKKHQDKDFINKLSEIFGLTNTGKTHSFFYPDLVLHESQSSSTKQEIICEIKTKDRINDDSLNKDLKKLAAYMTSGVLLYNPFKVGVFILIGDEFQSIKAKYQDNDYVKDKLDNIYCITYNVNGTENSPIVKCAKLIDIIEKSIS